MRHFTPDFNRNLSDELAKAIAKEGGVVQLSFGTVFLDAKPRSAFDQERRGRAEDMKRDGKSDAEIEPSPSSGRRTSGARWCTGPRCSTRSTTR